MMERKFSLFFYLFAPVLLIYLFYMSATVIVHWGNYSSLGIRVYDLLASDIFSMIILFITTQLMVLRIVGEKAPYGTLDRELITISKSSMFFGKLITNSIFVFIQCFLVYFSGFILFPAKNYGSHFWVFIFILLIGLFGLVSGLVISIFSKNKEQAVQIVPFYILIMMILSGSLIPLDQMSHVIGLISNKLPLTMGISSLKNLTLNGVGFEDVLTSLYYLISWIMGIGLIGLLKFKYEKK
ncbi:MAG: ABC transporter permease [Candidatus Nanoarchaeia archaeon]